MLFYAFKMALLFASLCVNASDYICSLNLHAAGTDTNFQIYLEAPRFSFLQLKALSSCPFGLQNIKNKFLGLTLFSFIFLCDNFRKFQCLKLHLRTGPKLPYTSFTTS